MLGEDVESKVYFNLLFFIQFKQEFKISRI
jgi:hypothetical protein